VQGHFEVDSDPNRVGGACPDGRASDLIHFLFVRPVQLVPINQGGAVLSSSLGRLTTGLDAGVPSRALQPASPADEDRGPHSSNRAVKLCLCGECLRGGGFTIVVPSRRELLVCGSLGGPHSTAVVFVVVPGCGWMCLCSVGCECVCVRCVCVRV
jgi:hypothetical protein